jgi:CRISPR-associated protein Csy3
MKATDMDPNAQLQTSNLSFCRSLETSEGRMYGIHVGKPPSEGDDVLWLNLAPVVVQQKTVRGTISNYLPPNKEYKFENANLQSIDVALMPEGCDHLAMAYSVTIVSNSLEPYATHEPKVKANFKELSTTYSQKGGYLHLAKRYLWNILNGRAFWRNTVVMFDKTVEVRIDGKLRAVVRAEAGGKGLDLRAYPGDEAMGGAIEPKKAFESMSREMAEALAGSGPALVLDVLMHGRIGSGMQVFPSQEFVRGDEAEKLKRANGNHDVGKVLASTVTSYRGQPVRQAVMHTQKIGNAIRWIDEWHGDDAHGAVPVDPYAALTLETTTLRKRDGKNNFYAYLKKPAAIIAPLSDGAALDAEAFGPTHFFMAMLIRGGVFGSKSEES